MSRPAPPDGGGSSRQVRSSLLAQVLAVREFRGMVLAQIASGIGDQFARIALALVVLERTGSAFGAAVTFAVTFIPTFLGAAFLGPLADRFSRRTLMLGADLGRAVIIAVLALLAGGEAPLWLLLTLLLLAEFLLPVFDAAWSAAIPSILVQPAMVSFGYGLGRTLSQVNQVVGFVLGGVVITLLGARAALLIDAASFVVSYLLLAAVLQRRRPTLEGSGSPSVLLRDMRDGAVTLARDPSRRALILLAWFLIATVVAPETLGLAYARDAGAPDWWGGVLMAAPVAGLAVGAYVVSRMPLRRQLDQMLALSVLASLPLLLTGLEPPLAVVVVLWLVAGALQGYLVSIMSLTALLTRDEHRGRVSGLAAAGFAAFSLVGTLAAGLLADRTSPAFAVTLIACVALAFAGTAVLLWPQRQLQRDVDGLEAG